MAYATGCRNDLDTRWRKNKKTRQECFHIRFHYLRSEEVVEKCFIEKLPPHIKPIKKSKQVWKGLNRAYGEYGVTFNQSFLTKRPASFEEDVHNTWFSNNPPIEMACMVVTGTTCGEFTIEKNAYFVVFQRGDKNSQLTFEKYHGIFNEIHSKQEKYVPKLLHAGREDNLCEFETRFVQQWNFLRTRYNSIFHGFLSFCISFGTFYVMNIESDSTMNVAKFNDLFKTINERKKKALQTATKYGKERTHVRVPYIFSFQPTVFSSTTKLRKIIEQFGFTRDSDEMKRTTMVKFKYPNVGKHNFDENGELFRIELSENKWFMATVLPAQSSAQLTRIKYGLKSFRNVKSENISKINLKLIETATNEYQMEPSCDIHRATEKVSELHSVTNWFGEKKVKLHIKTTTQLKGDAKKLVPCSSSKLVVLVLPEIPNRDTSEEELRSYARHIWKWAIVCRETKIGFNP